MAKSGQKRHKSAAKRKKRSNKSRPRAAAISPVPRFNPDVVASEKLQEMAVGLTGRELRDLPEDEAALTRLERGDYHRCMNCGEKIDIERLSVEPEAALCSSCQEESDKEAEMMRLPGSD